jgi:hypothetical protein
MKDKSLQIQPNLLPQLDVSNNPAFSYQPGQGLSNSQSTGRLPFSPLNNVGDRNTASLAFQDQGFNFKSILNKKNFGLATQGLQAVGGIMSMLQQRKQLALAEEQIRTENQFASINLANQADIVNNDYRNSSEVGLALAGKSLTPAQIAQERIDTENKFVKRTV